MSRSSAHSLSLCLCLALSGCKGQEPAPAAEADRPQAVAAAPAGADYKPVQEPLTGDPAPSLLTTQAWFYTGPDGKPRPGPARLQIWRRGAEGMSPVTLEDPESNVFHKAIPWNGGILTIGAEKALLKHWTFEGGKWTARTLWERSWGGKFNRLRDLEIGDVDGDGKDELVVATHDAGVVAVINPDVEGPGRVFEMDQKADTFVHEIELGDIDGDGKLEFFATPTDRNKVGVSQDGSVVMYRWDGAAYQRTVVDPMGATHAKEILARDLNGDGKAELFSVLEAELGPSKEMVKPVEIRQYHLQADGTFTHDAIATIPDVQTRFLVPEDVDGDGKVDLVAAAMKTGLWLLSAQADGTWKATNFDAQSSGFEHACYATDLDGDGRVELYVASDDQQQMRRYDWDKNTGRMVRTVLGTLPERTITWNITAGTL